MTSPIRKVEIQNEKVIDYQYIRNLKNKEVRKSRFKRTLSQRLLRFFLVLVLLAELAYLGTLGLRGLGNSRLFFVDRVEITGNHKTRAEEIRAIAQDGQTNVLFADLTRIKLRLENQPWIEGAVIWRELPRTIRIHVTERVPVCLVLAGNLYLVDHAGRLIDTYHNDPEYASLPVLTGIEDVADENRIRAGLSSVRALSADTGILRRVSEIHVYDKYSTIVYLRGVPFGLLVSKDGILPMIKKFLRYSDLAARNFPETKLIDLRYRGQIILKDSYKEQL
jgi:hypothetical protein